MSFGITALVEADASRCAEIEKILFPGDSPWPVSAFTSGITARNTHYFAARDDGELIGYAGIQFSGKPLSPTGIEGDVHVVAVVPERQGQGVGSALLLTMLDIADSYDAEVFLEVRTDNEPAIALYEREGFEYLGIRKRYYRPSGADAFSMKRMRRSHRPDAAKGAQS